MAKPTVYREAVAEEILAQLALGESLASICKDRRMPTYRTVISWLVRDFRGLGLPSRHIDTALQGIDGTLFARRGVCRRTWCGYNSTTFTGGHG
jgi:hypothetical protein